MKEEFPDGDRAKRTEVLSFFNELKEDYLSHDPELSQLSLEEIFPHFKSAGVRIYTYYSEHIEKSDEELRLEFMSLPVSEDFDESLLGLSDHDRLCSGIYARLGINEGRSGIIRFPFITFTHVSRITERQRIKTMA